MDADVITIETSRSDMELLEAFEAFDYPNDIGPGRQSDEGHADRPGDHADVVLPPRRRVTQGAGATTGAGHPR
ncbi:hypothetical protein ACQX2I_11790 [Corynebacterium diphtheriae]